MNILKTNGTIRVSTIIGGHLGLIVGAVIRSNIVYGYEVSMFSNNEWRIVTMHPNELKVLGDGEIQKIGFKPSE